MASIARRNAVKFKILCLLTTAFITHACLAGFTVWKLENSHGRTNYVVEAEVTEPPDYVTKSGMYFVSRYMKQVEFFAGSEALPWILTDKSKGSFMFSQSSGNLYFLSSQGTRFDMNRVAPDKWRLWEFTPGLTTVDQTTLVRQFLGEVFLVKENQEAPEDHLHVY